MTACTALKQAMDVSLNFSFVSYRFDAKLRRSPSLLPQLWEMEASCFKEYIPRITEGLMVLLLDELQLLDGKRRVLDALEVSLRTSALLDGYDPMARC